MNTDNSRAALSERTRTAGLRHDAAPSAETSDALPAIDWQGAENYRPEAVSMEVLEPQSALPAADVVVMTWTMAEWAALNHVFCDYREPMPPARVHDDSWREGWSAYSRNYYQIHQYMIDVEKLYQGGAPSLTLQAWGRVRMVSINGLKVLLVKSDMHLAQDGTGLPLLQFVEQICQESKPGLLLSIGTAGGVREEDALGCALVTNQAYFYLKKEFCNAPYNGTTVHSEWQPKQQWISTASQWLYQVEGMEIYPPSPQYPDTKIEPSSPDSEIKVVCDEPIITTDAFLFGTTENTLKPYGCIVEMDDAVVGMGCQNNGTPFGFVRNVSDPVIDARMPYQLQDTWAGYIYNERGLFTSNNGALATWALIAGESEKQKGDAA